MAIKRPMVIAPNIARSFIVTYSRILLDLAGNDSHRLRGASRTAALVAGRKKLMAKPNLHKVTSVFDPGDDEMVRAAIRGLAVRRWFYVRDTTRYSILLDAAREESYAVVGLTDPLRAIFGGPSVSFEAAVCSLGEHFICDGLFSDVLHIGPTMRAEFQTLHSRVARAGRFHRTP